MKLWSDGKNGSAGNAIKMKILEVTSNVNRQVKSRGVRVVNAIRTAELEVLKGRRSGRVYRKPYTKMATYTASAPGEPPARRTGNLRMHWNGHVEARNTSSGTEVTSVLESCERYAYNLENGTSKMAPRPFVEKIKETAMPEIQKIYSESYI